MKYTVVYTTYVSNAETVEADSPEEAAENIDGLSLCCQCKGDVGDVCHVVVADEDGNEVLTEDFGS